ncbi:MAG: sulfotransferase family protein, partial [Anaerolineae bacterium]|nr:sulfotransferase family protein [Anaerolineae bacterium]
FQEAMLSWPAGARPEDGSWAQYWYHSLHRSTGFGEYVPKTDPFPDSLKPLLAECQPYYRQLSAVAIKA